MLSQGTLQSWWMHNANSVWFTLAGFLLGAVANFVFWRLSEKPKRLDWEYMGTEPIVRLEPKDAGTLPVEVLFNGRPLIKPNIARLRIVNSGRSPIIAADYAQPIEIIFNDAVYLRADISASSNDEIEQKILFEELGGSEYRFTLDLLNRNEWFELRFLTDGDTRPPGVSARIAGQSKRMREMSGAKKSWIDNEIRILQITVFVFAWFFLAAISSGEYSIWSSLVTATLLSLFLLTLMAGFRTLGEWADRGVLNLKTTWNKRLRRR